MFYDRFRYVEMALRWICTPETPRLIREAMGELPGDLSSIYEGLFLMIERDRPQHQHLSRRIICWILCSQVQLKSEDFIDSVIPGDQGYAFDTTKEDILSVCHHLVVYNKTSDIFEFGHFSVNEFIRRHKQDEYSLNEAHNMCAWLCLRIMYNVTDIFERWKISHEVDETLEEYVRSVWEKSQKENLYYLTGRPEQRRESLESTESRPDVSPTSSIANRGTTSEFRSNGAIDTASGDNRPISRSSTPSFRLERSGTSRRRQSNSRSSTSSIHMEHRSKFSFPREDSPGYQDQELSEIPRISFYDYAFQFWTFHCRNLRQVNPESPPWEKAFELWFNIRVTMPWVYSRGESHLNTFVSGSIKETVRLTPLDIIDDAIQEPGLPDFTEWVFALSCKSLHFHPPLSRLTELEAFSVSLTL